MSDVDSLTKAVADLKDEFRRTKHVQLYPQKPRFVFVGRQLVRADLIEAVGLGPNVGYGPDAGVHVIAYTRDGSAYQTDEPTDYPTARAERDRIVAEIQS